MVFDSFDIKSLIRPVIDFPKPGVIFRDITPLFQSPTALRLVMDSFAHRYVEADFTHIGAMDARGFLIGSVLAYQLNKPLVLFRKQGKLPADVLAEDDYAIPMARWEIDLLAWPIHIPEEQRDEGPDPTPGRTRLREVARASSPPSVRVRDWFPSVEVPDEDEPF